MYIWNKVLVGVIGLASVFLLYLAARALNAQIAWSDAAEKHEKQIKLLTDQNRELLNGNGAQPGVRQLEIDLNKLRVDRRRIWPGCDPILRKPNKNKGTVEITVTVNAVNALGEPIPHGIVKEDNKGTVLYAFEEINVKNKGQSLGDFDHGQYLGEFAVTEAKAGDKKVSFKPTYVMTDSEIDRLVKAKRPWVLYESLPRDNHEIFESLTDAQKKAMLPADSVRDYLKDGKPAEKDDPKEDVVDGKYVRPLLDYGFLFDDAHEKRMVLKTVIGTLRQDKQVVLDSLEEARALADACAKEIASTKVDREKMEHERDLVEGHLKNLEAKLGDMEAAIARYTKVNQAMAGRIAKLQLEAAKRIDQRTREMAQSGTGRL